MVVPSLCLRSSIFTLCGAAEDYITYYTFNSLGAGIAFFWILLPNFSSQFELKLQ